MAWYCPVQEQEQWPGALLYVHTMEGNLTKQDRIARKSCNFAVRQAWAGREHSTKDSKDWLTGNLFAVVPSQGSPLAAVQNQASWDALAVWSVNGSEQFPCGDGVEPGLLAWKTGVGGACAQKRNRSKPSGQASESVTAGTPEASVSAGVRIEKGYSAFCCCCCCYCCRPPQAASEPNKNPAARHSTADSRHGLCRWQPPLQAHQASRAKEKEVQRCLERVLRAARHAGRPDKTPPSHIAPRSLLKGKREEGVKEKAKTKQSKLQSVYVPSMQI